MHLMGSFLLYKRNPVPRRMLTCGQNNTGVGFDARKRLKILVSVLGPAGIELLEHYFHNLDIPFNLNSACSKAKSPMRTCLFFSLAFWRVCDSYRSRNGDSQRAGYPQRYDCFLSFPFFEFFLDSVTRQISRQISKQQWRLVTSKLLPQMAILY